MATCPNGAIPDPAHATEAIAIQALAISADVIEWLVLWWPLAAATSVFAVMPVTQVCNTNMDDPGPIQPSMLLADLQDAALPGLSSPNGTLGWWLFNKALYAMFQRYCICAGTGTTPPTPQPPNLPTTTSPYPPGEDNKPQLTRIEDNQSSSAQGLDTIYRGDLFGYSYLSDIYSRVSPQLYSTSNVGFAMQNEGSIALNPFQQVDGSTVQTVLGVEIKLTAIPPTVKRQGTALPRLYGVGSVYWNGESHSGNPPLVLARDSIHYQRQFIWAPQSLEQFYLHWRLMPGVVATGYQALWNPDSPILSSPTPVGGALQRLSNLPIPPGWSDAPFYPRAANLSANRVWALNPG